MHDIQFIGETLKFLGKEIVFAISIIKFIKYLSLNFIGVKLIDVNPNKSITFIHHNFNTIIFYMKTMTNISYCT